MSREVADDADINGITERLFSIVKANVQSQVERAKGDIALKEMNGMNGKSPVPAASLPAQPANSAPRPADGKAGGPNNKPSSARQVSYIFRLGHKAGLSDEQVRQLPMQYYGKPDLQSLSSSDASRIIETLSDKNKAA
jgi:hypothetical protein